MNAHKLLFLSIAIATVFVLSSCSSNIPLEISEAPQGAPDFAQIQNDPDSFSNQPLRWGGTILSIENKPGSSWVTIVAFPLNKSGRPVNSDQSPGRFIAQVDEFLEPLVYSRDREITVRGKLVGTKTIKIGDFPYQYPLIQVENYHLWAKKPEINDQNLPYFWPYYPYYPDPYYNRRLYYR